MNYPTSALPHPAYDNSPDVTYEGFYHEGDKDDQVIIIEFSCGGQHTSERVEMWEDYPTTIINENNVEAIAESIIEDGEIDFI